MIEISESELIRYSDKYESLEKRYAIVLEALNVAAKALWKANDLDGYKVAHDAITKVTKVTKAVAK